MNGLGETSLRTCMLACAGAAMWAGLCASAQADEAKCKALSSLVLGSSFSELRTNGARATLVEFSSAPSTYCRIEGEILPIDSTAPPVRFRLNLPESWNRKSVQYGGGGLNGNLGNGLGGPADSPPSQSPLTKGYATVTTDGGHSTQPTPQAFALNDEALRNHAEGAYKKTHDAALAIIQNYYDAAPAKQYFVGSSEGGREALIVAQRFPKDFDAIFAGAPLASFMGVQLSKVGGYQKFKAEPFTDQQVELARDAALNACDALDGLKDGVISQTRVCTAKFDPSALVCKKPETSEACLSPVQAAWLKQIRTPYRFDYALANNERDYPPFGIGGESQQGGLAGWLKAQEPGEVAIVRTFVLKTPETKQDFTQKPNKERVQALSNLLDATNPDLSAFRARGGKLIIKANGADYVVSPTLATRYYQRVVQKLGQANTDSFIRYYLNPGVNHFGSGVQADGSAIPDKIDWVDVLDRWADRGEAPADLVLTGYPRPPAPQDGAPGGGRGGGGAPAEATVPPPAPVATRPLCRYPNYPHYNGGDAKTAASFECRADRAQ